MSRRRKLVHRVIGINRVDSDLNSYAQQVEAALNMLTKEGYAVATRQEPTGMLVHGELQSARVNPMMGFMDAMRMQQEEAASAEEPLALISPRTAELLNRFKKEIKPEDSKFNSVASSTSAVTTGFSVEELTAAALEIEKALKIHGKDTPCKGTCDDAHFYEAVLNAVKATARLNLQ